MKAKRDSAQRAESVHGHAVSLALGGLRMGVGFWIFFAFMVHVTIVTRSCNTTEAERTGYVEALPWGEP